MSFIARQAQHTECGVAALKMLLASHGIQQNMETLRHLMGVSRAGTNARTLIDAASHFGIALKAVRSSPSRLPSYPVPFIAYLGFRHFVLVDEIDSHSVSMRDPQVGRLRCPIEDFVDEFTGIVLVTEASGAFGSRHDLSGSYQAIAKVLPDIYRPAAVGILADVTATAMLVWASLSFELSRGGDAQWTLLCCALLAYIVHHATLEHAREKSSTSASRSLAQHVIRLPASFFLYRLPRSLHGVINNSRQMGDALHGFVSRIESLIATPVIIIGIAYLSTSLAAVVTVLAFAQIIIATLLERAAAMYGQGRLAADPAQGLFSGTLVRQIETFKTNGIERSLVDELLGIHAQTNRRRLPRPRIEFMLALLPALLAAPAMITIHLLELHWLAPVLVGWVFWRLRNVGLLIEDVRIIRDLAAFSDDVLDAREVGPGGGFVPSATTRGLNVRVNDVSFGYSHSADADVQKLSLTLEAGAIFGICGPTGSGKSTLAELISGQNTPWSGSIELEGQPLAAWQQEALAENVAIVDKIPCLFPGTVRENLTFRQQDACDADLWRVLEEAGIADELERRGHGLDCIILGQGDNFSGGQRQRLEIACALLQNPKLLILDEATDALEDGLEQQLLGRLRLRGCTVLLITHRVASLALCDQQRHMEKGQLTDQVQLTGTQTDPQPEKSKQRGSTSAGVVHAEEHAVPGLADAVDTMAKRIFGSRHTSPTELSLNRLRTTGMEKSLHFRQISTRRAHEVYDQGPLITFDTDGTACVNAEGKPSAQPRAPAEGLSAYPDWSKRPVTICFLLKFLFINCGRDLATLALTSLSLTLLVTISVFAVSSDATFATSLVVGLAAATGIGIYSVRHVVTHRLETQVTHNGLAAFWLRFVSMPVDDIKAVSPIKLGKMIDSIPLACQEIASITRRGWLGYALIPLLAFLASSTDVHLLSFASLLLAGVGVVTTFAIIHRKVHADHLIQQSTAKTKLLQCVFAFRQVRSSAARQRAIVDWESSLAREATKQRQLNHLLTAQRLFLYTFPFIAAIIIVVPSSALQVDVILTSLAAGVSVSVVLSAYAGGCRAVTPLIPVIRFMQQPSEQEKQPGSANHRGAVNGEIEVKALSVNIPESSNVAVSNVSFRLKAGEILAITGPSGVGKTTLLKAIANLRSPTSGQIFFDGTPMEDWDLGHLRSQFGAIWQGDEITEGSLRDNVTFAAHYTLPEVWQALAAAGLADEVEAMPRKVDSHVSEYPLSAGQKQRLLLARQLIRKPRLLLLDEATSSVDTGTEAHLFDYLRDNAISCLVISHRKETLQRADWLLTIESSKACSMTTNDSQRAAQRRPEALFAPPKQVQDMMASRLFNPAALNRFLSGRRLDEPMVRLPFPTTQLSMSQTSLVVLLLLLGLTV